ncbi:addiction module toxin RelE [Gammaproteobacteria bacterium 50_400_T64]|nr:addiction module toxin RelE [Gammaproteobacteria bacterium 50_400_T64]
MDVFVSSSAYIDLENIGKNYNNQGMPHIGKQFITAIMEHAQTLIDNPSIGRVVPEFGEERIRALIHSPFRIVYLKEQNSVHVIRVWRSERLLKLPDSET